MDTIIVISGLSGCGKSSIIDLFFKRNKGYSFSTSYTTRHARDNEIDGESYFFVSRERFNHMLENKDMIEHVNILGNLYGTCFAKTIELLKKHEGIIFDIDYHGYKKIKEYFNKSKGINVIGIWIDVEKDIVLSRLKKRGGETSDNRIEYIKQNYDNISRHKDKYDYTVKNDDITVAVKEIENIIIG